MNLNFRIKQYVIHLTDQSIQIRLFKTVGAQIRDRIDSLKQKSQERLS